MPRPLKPLWARLKASPIGYRLARGAFWTLMGTFFARGFALAGTIVVARVLGKETFGALGMVQSTVGMFSTFAGFGLGVMATKHIAEFRKTDPQRAGRIIYMSECMCWVTGGIAALGMFFAAPWLAVHSLANPDLAGVLRISAVYLLFTSVNGGQQGVLTGFEAFRQVAQVNLWTGILNFAFSVAGCWIGGLAGAIWGFALSQALVCAISLWIIKCLAQQNHVPMIAAGWNKELPLIWKFSLPVVLINFLGMPVAWVCQSYLMQQKNGCLHVADFYGSMQLRNIPLAAVGVVTASILPVYANTRKDGDGNSQDYILRLVRRMMVFGVFPILLVMGIFAEFFLSSYGKAFSSGEWVLRLLLVSVVFEALANIQIQIIMGDGKVWNIFCIYAVSSFIFIIIAFWLVPSFYASGLAIAWIAITVSRWLLGYYYLRTSSLAQKIRA